MQLKFKNPIKIQIKWYLESSSSFFLKIPECTYCSCLLSSYSLKCLSLFYPVNTGGSGLRLPEMASCPNLSGTANTAVRDGLTAALGLGHLAWISVVGHQPTSESDHRISGHRIIGPPDIGSDSDRRIVGPPDIRSDSDQDQDRVRGSPPTRIIAVYGK